MIIKSAERSGDICALRFLHLVHKFTNIRRHRVHSQRIKTTLQHMGLDSHLMKRCCPTSYGYIRILTEKEVNLLESTSISLDPVETSHVNDGRCNFFKLVYSRHIFAGRLPHIPVNQRELYFSCHIRL